MADPARREAGSQREGCGFSGNLFLTVVADGVISDRAGGIEKNIVGSPIIRSVQAQRELMMRRKVSVELIYAVLPICAAGYFPASEVSCAAAANTSA